MDRLLVTRRTFAASAVLAALAGGWPLRAADPAPLLPSGVASGDVTHDAAIVWSRCDRPARMFVEYAATADFRNARRAGPVRATADSDCTARVELAGLPPGRVVHYRVWFRDDADRLSPPVAGRLRTAPAPGQAAEVFFAWSGDTCGQGFGINPEWGGLKIYDAIRRREPHFFVHSGDTIYADNPLRDKVALADGSTWVNVVTPAKSHVAVTLDDFRGNYAYNLLDEHVRRFHGEVAQVVQWDDHETTNNWYPDQILANRKDAAAYAGVRLGGDLAGRARQAFFEYMPIRLQEAERGRIYRSFGHGSLAELFVLDQRSYRGPNTPNVQPKPGPESAFLGAQQLKWLKDGLKASKATWKVICSDMPIGLVVGDGGEGKAHFEAVANGDNGPPLGREAEFAELFGFLHENGVKNLVWLTADVHYAAAHHYGPERAGWKEKFEPFWEFVAGPLHAGTFGPPALDMTFGPEVRFQWAPRAGLELPGGYKVPQNFRLPLPPSAGMQSFGTVRIDPLSRVLTVEFRDLNGELIHDGRRLGRFELEPAR